VVATDRKRGRRIKRALDLIIAGLGVLLTAPLMLLIAFMIKLDSTGSVLFVQERLGQGRVPFPCFKFRTMCEDAERHTGPIWSHADDPVSPLWDAFCAKRGWTSCRSYSTSYAVKCPWSVPVRSAVTLRISWPRAFPSMTCASWRSPD
jgi:hypothetical protein